MSTWKYKTQGRLCFGKSRKKKIWTIFRIWWTKEDQWKIFQIMKLVKVKMKVKQEIANKIKINY